MISLIITLKRDIFKIKRYMVAVITGDVINSKKNKNNLWLTLLKKELNKKGKTPKVWEIYRGDSFQVLLEDPAGALELAIKIKAALRSIEKIDVRMAIGLGKRTYNAARVTESNGSAFVHSGEKFEILKQEKQNIAIKSDWETFDKEMNLYLKLSLIAMDRWTTNAAESVKIAMDHPSKLQQQLGKMLGIKQNTISNRLKRAFYVEIMEVNEIYKSKLKSLQ